VMVIKK